MFSLLRLGSESNSQKTHTDIAEIADTDDAEIADTDVAESAEGGMEVGIEIVF